VTFPKPTLGFVGAGKVGHTLARLWYQRGYRVRAVYSLTDTSALALAAQVGATVAESPLGVMRTADLTLLTVPDGAITEVISAILLEMKEGEFTSGEMKAVVHTSGALEAAVLSGLSDRGMMVGSFHPAFPFADVETAVAGLPGSTFGMQADSDGLRVWLEALVAVLDGYIMAIPPGGKAAYHSAFVFASNYVVTLYAVAERLLVSLGAGRAAADHALNTLLAGTVENVRRQGIPVALTGPLVRGDAQTIQAHLDALGDIDDDLLDLYRQLARLSLPMLAARQLDTTFVEHVLNREDHHAADHS